jgi:hypothetical protein
MPGKHNFGLGKLDVRKPDVRLNVLRKNAAQ